LPYPTTQNADQDSNVYSANLVHVFSPTLTNEFIFAEATFLNPIGPGQPQYSEPQHDGIQHDRLFTNPYTPMMPNTYGWAPNPMGSVGF